MPYIDAKLSVSLSREQELRIKTRLGEAIALIPGKSEHWLMCQIEDRCKLYFQGTGDRPAAFAAVKLLGGASEKAYQDLTAAVTGILSEEAGVPADRIYVQYEECEHWGFNGRNF